MKRAPTDQEREKIVRSIAAGDRIEALSVYISITECGLTEAQNFIKALDAQTAKPDRQPAKPSPKKWWKIFS